MSTRNVKTHHQEALITEYVSQFLETSAPNCETAPLHAKNNEAWSDNNTEDVRNLSTETNGELRLLSMPEQQRHQVTPHKKREPHDPTLIKNKNKLMGYGARRKGGSRQKRDEKSPSLKEKENNRFPSIKNNDEIQHLRNIERSDERSSPNNNDDLRKPSSIIGGKI